MKKKLVRTAAVIMIFITAFAMLPAVDPAGGFSASADSLTAMGRISTDGVNLRSGASSGSQSIKVLKANTKVRIYTEIFTSETSSKASTRWYYVKAKKKMGYVRADYVKSITYGSAVGTSTDALNYRTGPAVSFKKLGTVAFGTTMPVRIPARIAGRTDLWYKVRVNGKTAYVSGGYIRMGTSAFITKTEKQLKGKSDLARALLSNPTNGGKARVVYTFTKDNCKKLFAIKGYKNARVPQGFTFTGSKYYICYGMAAGQAIVTYSAGGTRLAASKFSFCIGHPNGITWDPVTKKCYIFKGYQKRIYTWNPRTNKFGRSKTPYSSSGVGYDDATKQIYATSHTGIRAYSSDGKFVHQKLFSRCNHGIFHYIQDCGAGKGFVFHGISGKKKKKTNYLDIYRVEDNAYLGSIKITIGEYESAVVGNDGYLQLLINTDGYTDYVWKTPLNVNELK